jgi:hypothetical protein
MGLVAAGATALLALATTGGSPVPDPLPAVGVFACVEGRLFGALTEEEQQGLRHLMATHFIAIARQRLPMMAWVEQGRVEQGLCKSAPNNQALATVFVKLYLQSAGNTSYLHLSLWATVPGGGTDPEALGKWADWPVLPYVDYAANVGRLRQAITDFIDARPGHPVWWTDEFEKHFYPAFVSQVPIADHIDVDPEHQRLILPLEAEHLALPDGLQILVELTARFCRDNLERCTLVLESRGPVYVGPFQGRLQCQLMRRITCCTEEAWTPELAEQIRQASGVQVFLDLDATHRRCPFDKHLCGERNGLFRTPGEQ